MVAVITGNGLGLGNTSLTQLGQSQGGSPSLGQAGNRSYANTATGNLILQSADEGLLFDGLPLNVLRTYNSLGQLSSNGWSYGFSRTVNGLTGTLNTAGSTITRTGDDGSSVIYTYNATLGVYQSTDQSGAVDILSWNATASTWTWTDAAASTQETYNATGQLTALTDTSSGASYSFSYSNGQLSQIVAGDGDKLIFGYNTNSQLISLTIQEVPPGQSTAVTRQAVSYGYDTLGRLAAVTTVLGSDTDSNSAGYSTSYTYVGNTDLVASVTQSDGTTVSYSYNGNNQIARITTGTGSDAQTLTLSYDTNDTTVTDGLGNATQYHYNAQGQLTQVIAPTVNGGSPTSTYTYDANGNLLTSTDPNGAVTSYTYDVNGNLLSVEDGAGNTVSYTYNTNDQVTSKTTYAVPAQGEAGQSGYVAPSGAETTYYVYNAANQLAYTIDALGAVTENDYTTVNGLSELTTTRQYLGATYSTSSNSPGTPPTLVQLQAWVQSAAVQSTLSQSTRTDYTYDVRGQLATQTQYDTVDAGGNGVLTSGTVITTTTYDVQGKLLHTSAETGANRSTLQTTTYAYDGLGRVISKTDPLGNVTTYVYTDNGSNDTLVITQANGLITTQVRSSAGLLVSSTQSTAGTSSSSGSGSGNNNQVNLTVKDAQGRVVAQISYEAFSDPTNIWNVIEGNMLTLTSYDSQGQVNEGVLYKTPLTAQQIASLGSNPTLAQLQALATPGPYDQVYLVVKDGQGRTVAQVGDQHSYSLPGAVANKLITTTYNSAGEVSSTTHYATSLTSTQILSLGSNPTVAQLQALAPSASDLTNYYVYDDQGRVTAQLAAQIDTVTNADGSTQQVVDYYVTTTSYGGAGGVSGTVQYATPLTQAQVASLGSDPTLAQVQALVTPSDNDQASLKIEDAQGHVIGQITYEEGPGFAFENMLSLTSYDSQGNVSEGILYMSPLTGQQIASLGSNPTLAQLQALATPGPNDQVYLAVKDDQGRTVAQVGSLYSYFLPLAGANNLITTTYNSAGEVSSTTHYATLLTSTQVLSLGSNPTVAQLQALAPSASDLTTYYVYDDQGRVAAQLVAQIDTVTNADGSTQQVVDYYVTTTSYGGAGGISGTVQYATPLTQAQVASLGSDPTLAQVQALLTPSDNDQANLQIEDAQGHVIGRITYEEGPGFAFENMLSLTSYDSQGNVSEGILYMSPLTGQQIASLGSNPTLAQLQALATPGPNDQVYLVIKDDQGRTVAQVGSLYSYLFPLAGANKLITTTYNSAGEISSTTNYATQLTSSQILSLGSNPTVAQLQALAPSATDLTTYYVYDNQGRVVAKIAGQVDTVTNADGSTQQLVDYYLTTTSYGSNGSVSGTVRYGTPLTQAQVNSLASDPTLAQVQVIVNALGGGTGQGTSTSVAGRTTQFIYNADGELVAQIDPLGDATFTFYDADGRVAGTVDPTGAVTAYAYDSNGNVIRTTHYAITISTTGWLSNSALTASVPSSLPLPGVSSADLTTTSIYDATGNVVATIDQAGNVTTISYDGNGDVIATTEYATPLTSGQMTALGDAPTIATLMADVVPSAEDRTTLTIYDADWQATAVIDPDGNVKVMSYDAAGDLVGSTVYPTPLTAAQIQQLRSTQTMATLTSLLSAAAQNGTSTTRAIYNAAGQQVATIDPNGDASYSFYNSVGLLAGTVDADGDVTAYTYDADGRLTQTIQYATSISTAGWLSASDTLTATYPASLPIPSSSSNDRVTTKIYDSVGRVVANIDPSGDVTVTTYDVFGEAISRTQYATPLTSAQMAALGGTPTLTTLQAVIAANANDRTATAEYNSDGLETKSIDAAGYITTYQYDADGHVVLQSRQVSGNNYAITRNYYDGAGRQVAQVDADGYLTVFSYDGTTDTTTSVRYATALTASQNTGLTGAETTSDLIGMLGSSTVNEQASKTYNADNQVISSTATDGTVTTYQYDADGQLIGTVITPTSGQGAVRTTSVSYDSRGNVISTTDADGNTTTYVYDTNGQRIGSTDANGNSTWYYYDPAGRLLYSVQGQPANGSPNSLGDVTAYAYDAFGDITRTTIYAAQLTLTAGASSGSALNPANATVAQVATAIAALAAVSADVNNVITTTYTANGQVASVTDGDGYQATNSYDAFGDKVSVTDGAGNTATYTYDARGEQVSETDGAGSSVARTTSNTYDAFGRVTSHTDGNGNTITYSYDDLGRQIGSSQVVQGVARATQTTYDAFGHVLTETDALGNVTTFSYDIAAHTAVMTTPLGVTTTTVKDAFGNVVSVMDGAGNTTAYTYDADGRLLTTTDGLGNTSTNRYDSDGNLILTTDANGNEVSYTYDASGWVLTKTVDPNGLHRVTSYTYDGQGRELSVTAALGSVTAYTYDADGNMLSMVQDAGGGGHVNLTTTYTYDGNGKLLTETKGAGSNEASTTQYIYDNLGRLSESILDPSGLNLVTSYRYDANDNLVATTDPNGNTSFTLYNEANEAVYRIDAAGTTGSALASVTQYWYDANGNLVSTRAYSNLIGVGSLAGIDPSATAQMLGAGASMAAAAATTQDAISYTVYNADGQTVFQIDPMKRVTEARYNTLGQMAQTLAYAAPISLDASLVSALQAGTAQPSDIQNRLPQASDSDGSVRSSYLYYDADGHVVYMVTPNMVDGVLGAVVSETQYDAAGLVISDTVYGVPLSLADVGAGSTTASIEQAVAQSNTAATTRSTQYFYDAAGEKVAETDPNGRTRYTFYDDNGLVAATVDAAGAVVHYERDALGRVTRQTASSATVSTSGWLVGGEITITLPLVLARSTSEINRVTVTSYDVLGRIATVTHFSSTDYPTDGDTLSYVYDNDSRVIQTTDIDLGGYSADRVTDYFYDADGNNVATLDADGYLAVHAYDAAGQLTQTSAYATQVVAQPGETLAQLIPGASPQDQVTTYYYDARGNLVGTIDAMGFVTQYTYDLDGAQLSATRYADKSGLGASASFDAIVQGLIQAGSSSHQTTHVYDSYGEVVTSMNYEGVITSRAYDNLGNLLQETVAAGTSDVRTTTWQYDAFGNVVSTTDGVGNVTTYTYDLPGNKTSMTDAQGNTTWYVYDADNRIVYTIRGIDNGAGVQNSLGEVSEQHYDAFGDVAQTVAYSGRIAISAGFSPTPNSVAAAVRAISGQGPSSDNYIDYTYDLEGNVIGKDDGNGNQFNYTYDGFNDRSSTVDAAYNGLASFYTYDDMGHMTQEIDGNETISSSSGEYFGSGEVTINTPSGTVEIIDPLRTQEWTYDAFGNMASYTNGDGATTSYSYDNLNRQSTQSLAVSGLTRETVTSYDAYGRVLSSTDAMGLVTTYSYDDATRSTVMTSPGGTSTTTTYNREGQKIAITDAAGNTTSYQYDADGNLLKTVNPDGSAAANQYDADGNLIKTTDADGNVIEYAYDAVGRVLTKTVDPNGLKLVTTYTYDGRGLTMSKVDATGVETDYQYDGNGNLVYTEQDAGQVDAIRTTYQYNELNELTSSSAEGVEDYEVNYYGYDAFGHLTGERLDTGKEQSVSYTYDADGHVTSKTDGIGNHIYYFYDEAGEQVYTISPVGGGGAIAEVARAEIAPGSAPGLAVTRIWYNADGQVVGTTAYATPLGPYVLNGFANGDISTSDVASFIASSDDDRSSYAVYNADGQVQYSIDATGAVTESVYNANGQVSETLAYANQIDVSPTLASALQAGTATAADIQSALASAGDSSANARITYTYYDNDGRVSFIISVGSLNSQSGGLVQQTQYDANGNIVARIQYGDLIPLSQVGGSATTASISQYLAGNTHIQVTRSVYDAAGRKVYSIDAGNNVTETQYDGDGRVTWALQYANSIAAPASWDVADVAAAVQAANTTNAMTRGTENVYDAFGNVIETYSRASSNPTSVYTYNGRGLKTSYTDASGNTWFYDYDDSGNLVAQYSPSVDVASYSSSGEYAGVTSESIVTVYHYDGNGNLVEEIDDRDNLFRDTEYTYDAAGNLITTSYSDPGKFDPTTGAVVATGNHPAIAITYNAFGEAVVSQDANGNYAYNVYDADGRLAYAVDGDGYVTGYQYDAYGDQTSVTRYATRIDTSSVMDNTDWWTGQPLDMSEMAVGLVTSSADRTITTTYDAQGNKLTVTEPAITYTNSDGTTATGSPVAQYTYDAYGHITSQSVLVQGTQGQTDAVWATTYNYYDALGHRIMSVDPMGYVTANTYDAFGDVVATTEYARAIDTTGLVAGGTAPALPPAGNTATGLDRVTLYTYDNNGNKASVSVQRSYVNAQGQSVVGFDTTTYGYDANNRLTTVTENGNTITTAYDALGRISSVTGPQVEVLRSNWQALLEANPSLTLSDPSLYTLASQVVTYAYDALGNKLVQTTSSTDSSSSQSVSTYYQYDGAGRVVAEMTPLGASGVNWLSPQVKYMAYDSNGNLISQSYTLTGNDNTTATVTTINTYDADNQRTSSITSRLGVPTPDKSTSTTYDAFGEVVASGDGVTDNVVNTYDNAGNKIASTDPKTGEVHTYGYNLAGQLVSDTVPVAASAGGGTTQTLYTLDLDGRIVAEQAPSTNSATGENSGILHATYDAWGNVLSATDANGNITTYTYNERNDVVTETEASVTVVGLDGSSTTSAPVKTSVYDIEGNVVASTDENKNVITTVYNALGQKVESINGAGNTLYYAYDAIGNQVGQQDGNGNITFSNVDALGRTVQSGEFEFSTNGSSRQAVWQQAYVLDQNGNRIISYDGIGSAYLQSGDTTNAALHANYDGYDSQGRVIWSQDAAQRAASTANAHGLGNYGAGSWTQTPTNADFSQGMTGWTFDPGYSTGSYNYDGQVWPLMFSGTNNANGIGGAVNNDRVPVVPGQTITASAQFDVLSANGNGEVFINWYDADGKQIHQDSNGPGITGGNGAGVNSVTATAPPGAAFAAIAIGCSNYNEGYPGVVCSGVSWTYTAPAYITSLGTGTGGAVVMLPSGSFTDQVTNGDFEQGNVGWDLSSGWGIGTASNTANGQWIGTYNGNGVSSMVNQDRVPVTEGQSITASIQVSLYLAPDGAEASGTAAINWYDANGNLIKTSTGNTVYSDHKGAWKTSTVMASAPPGAAYASFAVYANTNGIGGVSVDAARWNYQYIPQVPTGVVEDTYVYDMDGNLVSQTTADGDTESWQYNQYGQVTQHTDLSGAQYTYTYDANTGAQIGESDNWSPAAQGQLLPAYVTAPTTTPNSETLSYYADGQIATESFSDGSTYSYQYDNNGNLIHEEDSTVDGNNNVVHTVTQTTYDSHNRITHVVETNAVTNAVMLDETFSYDAAGNRREVRATSNGTTQDAWYTYDGDNRVEVANGSLQNGQIVIINRTGSYENAYDADGNVIKIYTRMLDGDLLSQTQRYDARNELTETDYAVDVTTGAANEGIQKLITYDADGHALVTQTYYQLGSTVEVQQGKTQDGSPNIQDVDVGGELQSATVNFYDAVGRLAESQTFNNPSGWNGSPGTAPTGAPVPDATTYGSLTLQSEVVYQGPNGSSGYDADGDVVGYQYRDSSRRVDQYQVTYLKKDTYLQADTTGDSNTANVQPATDQAIYNTRGNEVALEQHTEDPYGTIADTVHVFAYNGNGEIIEREDATGSSGSSLDLGSSPNQEIQNYTYVNGQQLAHFDNAGTLDVLDQVTAFSSNNDSPNSYVVQSGDTLESIAQAEYGNANLWYVIAQANDLSSDTNLVLGERLQIPAVTTHANSATTFKPYDPSSIIGNTTPNLPTIAPPPPPPNGHGCGVVGQIVMIAVMIAVTVMTGGVAGAILGSLAGQLVGDALGVHHGISLGELALAAVTAGVAEGVGSVLPDVSSAFVNAAGDGLSFAGSVVQGAATYVAADAAGKIVGEPEHFSWVGLVASGLANGVASEIGPSPAEQQAGVYSANPVENVLSVAAGDVVRREVSVALGDRHVPSWAQVGEDVAGNALGNAAVFGIRAYQAQHANDQLADKVTSQATNDINALNDRIWNGVTTDASAELANQGQAALDAALGQAQLGYGSLGSSLTSTSGATGNTAAAPVSGVGKQGGGGFVIMTSGDPSNPSDVAALQAERTNIVKFLASQNGRVGGVAYPMPPDVSDFQGLLDYGKQLSNDYYAPENNYITRVTPQTALQLDQEDATASREESASFFNQFRGSFWGDMGANAGTLLTDAGSSLIGGALAVKDILTDRPSAEQAARGAFALATSRPTDIYNHLVDSASRWLERPLDEQMRDVGDAGMGLLTSLGAGEAVIKAVPLGAAGVRLVGNGLEQFGDALSQLRFSGSAGGFDTLNSQIGAVGDLSKLRPSASGLLNVAEDAAAASDIATEVQVSTTTRSNAAEGAGKALPVANDGELIKAEQDVVFSASSQPNLIQNDRAPILRQETTNGGGELTQRLSGNATTANLHSLEDEVKVGSRVGNVSEAASVGVPATRAANPLSPVLEYDAYGNEIYYRTMKESHYKILEETGRLTGTGETSLAPLEAYSAEYDGALVRLTTKPGTSAQLQQIGIAANEPTAAEFPNMSTRTGSWNQTNARFKIEATDVMNINDGLGIMNTQLGKGSALDIFNANLLDFERLN